MTESLSRQNAGRIKELFEQGMPMRRIERDLGVPYGRVRRICMPDDMRERDRRDNARRNAEKRQWEQEHDRPPCPKCGQPMSVGAHRDGYKQCQRCVSAAAGERMTEMVRLRNEEGLDTREIAARYDVAPHVVAKVLSRARAAGFEVARSPYMANRREALANG